MSIRKLLLVLSPFAAVAATVFSIVMGAGVPLHPTEKGQGVIETAGGFPITIWYVGNCKDEFQFDCEDTIDWTGAAIDLAFWQLFTLVFILVMTRQKSTQHTAKSSSRPPKSPRKSTSSRPRRR